MTQQDCDEAVIWDFYCYWDFYLSVCWLVRVLLFCVQQLYGQTDGALAL